MQVDLAHVRESSTTGQPIDFAVFGARSTSGSQSANMQLLSRLTIKAQAAGLKIDQSALAFRENGKIRFFGSRSLVEHLSRIGVPQWTHKIDV
jgi:hypothetical protein